MAVTIVSRLTERIVSANYPQLPLRPIKIVELSATQDNSVPHGMMRLTFEVEHPKYFISLFGLMLPPWHYVNGAAVDVNCSNFEEGSVKLFAVELRQNFGHKSTEFAMAGSFKLKVSSSYNLEIGSIIVVNGFAYEIADFVQDSYVLLTTRLATDVVSGTDIDLIRIRQINSSAFSFDTNTRKLSILDESLRESPLMIRGKNISYNTIYHELLAAMKENEPFADDFMALSIPGAAMNMQTFNVTKVTATRYMLDVPTSFNGKRVTMIVMSQDTEFNYSIGCVFDLDIFFNLPKPPYVFKDQQSGSIIVKLPDPTLCGNNCKGFDIYRVAGSTYSPALTVKLTSNPATDTFIDDGSEPNRVPVKVVPVPSNFRTYTYFITPVGKKESTWNPMLQVAYQDVPAITTAIRKAITNLDE